MSRWTNWLGPLDCTDNLKALKEAYEIGVMEMPAEVYKETGYQLNQFLDALIPGLIQALIALAASTALGGAIGAVVGAFFGGAGAIPGAVGGAAVGFDLGLAVLGWLGLGFLAYSIGHSLGELTALLELAVRRAWDAPNSPQPRVQIRLAGKDFARSGAILIRLVLQGIAMWLTQKGVNKIGELVAELRKSKLGPRFAAWVEENAAALMRDPRLKPHRGQGSAGKEVVSEAQSPSQLSGRKSTPAEPPPPQATAKPKATPRKKPRQPQQYERKVVNEDGSTTYTLKTKDGSLVDVTYRDGYPDFSPHKYEGSLGKNEVQINMTGKNNDDFKAANQAAGFGDKANSQPKGYTWHHHQDGTTMQLVRTDAHAAAQHTGGASAARLKGSP